MYEKVFWQRGQLIQIYHAKGKRKIIICQVFLFLVECWRHSQELQVGVAREEIGRQSFDGIAAQVPAPAKLKTATGQI